MTQPSPQHRPRGALVAAGAFCLAGAMLGSGVASASALVTDAAAPTVDTAAARGTEQGGGAPRVVTREDFEHGLGTTPVFVTDYVGPNGETYTADPIWIDAAACNGIVTSASSTRLDGCEEVADLRLHALAAALGEVSGTDPTHNHVVSAYTNDGSVVADAVQLASKQAVPLAESGRYLSFGVDAAAVNCSAAHPLLAFSLVDGDTEHPVSDRPIDPCADPAATEHVVSDISVRAGHFVSDGAVLVAGDSLRWVMRNAQGSGAGNDGAIDSVVVYDSTPTLATTIAPTASVGTSTRLTFTVRNTSEQGAKPGWSFTERLPAGLEVARTATPVTTCANGMVEASGGASSIVVHGDLAAGSSACTVSVDVTSAEAGTYVLDGAATEERLGLDLGTPSTVRFEEVPAPSLSTTLHANLAATDASTPRAGDAVELTADVVNTGNVTVRDLAGSLSNRDGTATCTPAVLEPGATASCTLPDERVTQDELQLGSAEFALDVTATTADGATVTADDTRSVGLEAGSSLDLTADLQSEGEPDAVLEPGMQVRSSYVVANTGNLTVTAPAVAAEPGTPVQCADAELAPGAVTTCAPESSYVITAVDADAGSVVMHAQAKGLVPRADGVGAEPAAVRSSSRAAAATAVLAAAHATVVDQDSVVTNGQVWVFSNETTRTFRTAPHTTPVTPTKPGTPTAPGTGADAGNHLLPKAAPGTGSATSPQGAMRLAYTGTEVVSVGVPAAGVLLALATLLWWTARRRRQPETSGAVGSAGPTAPTGLADR